MAYIYLQKEGHTKLTLLHSECSIAVCDLLPPDVTEITIHFGGVAAIFHREVVIHCNELPPSILYNTGNPYCSILGFCAWEGKKLLNGCGCSVIECMM